MAMPTNNPFPNSHMALDLHILFVDDDPAIRHMVFNLLRKQGYTVITAGSGEEAIEIFQQQPDAIQLVVSDVSMPRMNGLELADRLREIRPELRVLFVSGDACQADRGFGCVSKPFTASQLAARVCEILSPRD